MTQLPLRLLLAASLAGALAGSPAQAAATSVSPAAILDGAPAPPPPGFVTFCIHYPQMCAENPPAPAARVELNEQNRRALNAVNDAVNRAITYQADRQTYGAANIWNPNAVGGLGDCKDYALAKQQALIAAGLPPGSLRLAIVMTRQDELHAVLTVATDKGDLVLDSIAPEILPWRDTSYSWLSRQSPDDPLQWVTIDGAGSEDPH